MKDDLHFLRLWDLYSPLLTPTQREITDLYFNYDLSFGEIAEQKGVSRQSVSDCLQKCRKQLEGYEEKLGFDRALTQADEEYSAYMTTVNRWISSMRESRPKFLRSFKNWKERSTASSKNTAERSFRQTERIRSSAGRFERMRRNKWLYSDRYRKD